MIKSVYLHHLKRKTHGVTVAHQILVLFVGVRIPVGLHSKLSEISESFFIFIINLIHKEIKVFINFSREMIF